MSSKMQIDAGGNYLSHSAFNNTTQFNNAMNDATTNNTKREKQQNGQRAPAGKNNPKKRKQGKQARGFLPFSKHEMRELRDAARERERVAIANGAKGTHTHSPLFPHPLYPSPNCT